ncbi:hypothetical protein AMTR_s00003p00251050 [Amborella trichopoda]|uniref:Uncharacterized protein n=1 Tax=Amborella trichopoda TaxID=13333 RepID=W1P6S4_AMBTC|nr:hypothetical protein AMTR_s00003p00251050 [Amborella trichopoda]
MMEEGVEVEQSDIFINDIAAEVDDEAIEEATTAPLGRHVTMVGGDTKAGGGGQKWKLIFYVEILLALDHTLVLVHT